MNQRRRTRAEWLERRAEGGRTRVYGPPRGSSLTREQAETDETHADKKQSRLSGYEAYLAAKSLVNVTAAGSIRADEEEHGK